MSDPVCMPHRAQLQRAQIQKAAPKAMACSKCYFCEDRVIKKPGRIEKFKPICRKYPQTDKDWPDIYDFEADWCGEFMERPLEQKVEKEKDVTNRAAVEKRA